MRAGFVLTITALCSSLSVFAQEYPLTKQDITPDKEYDFQLPSGPVLANPEGVEKHLPIARELARKSTHDTMKALLERGIVLGVLPPNKTPVKALASAPGLSMLPEGMRASILISSAMGEGTIKALVDKYRLRKDVRFVFRGIPEGMSVPEFGFWLKEIVAPESQEIDDVNITIDPELFELAGATLAPTLLLEDLNATDPNRSVGTDLGIIVARSEGFPDPDWVYDQYQKGTIDHKNPNVVEISEEDLRNRARREAHQVAQRLTRDQDVIKKRYWGRKARQIDAYSIKSAGVDRERVLHFMFHTNEAIKDHKGNILAHSGEVFRPNDVLPFDRRVFVFNPNSEYELAFVEAALKERRPGVSRTMLVLSEIPQTTSDQEPWHGIQALIDRFGTHVFLLNDQFRAAFQIEFTPTEIFPRKTETSVDVISLEHSLL